MKKSLKIVSAKCPKCGSNKAILVEKRFDGGILECACGKHWFQEKKNGEFTESKSAIPQLSFLNSH